jgi:cob(I)alamin adenosyltransferase
MAGYNYTMTPLYTKTGDDGYTGLLGDNRVPKDHPQIEAIGTLDEVTAAFGVARATCRASEIGELIVEVQRDLYNLMIEIAASPKNTERFPRIDINRINWLEQTIEGITKQEETPNEFILPGDSPGGAALDLARTVTRRAERRVVELLNNGIIQNNNIIPYLNRLSSLCFALELLENKAAGKQTPTLAKR